MSIPNDGVDGACRATFPTVPHRRGYTLIEIMLVLAIIAIMAAMALPKISFVRFRQDANGRLVQRTLISAQQTSMRAPAGPTNVLFVIDYAASRMRIVEDTNSNGVADGAEHWTSWGLDNGAVFAIPPVTVDGATAYYATGPGITTTAGGPTITFYPNGSASGDAFLYVGLANGRSDALRAIEFAGATGRTRLWRYLDGAWRRDSL
jgi:prepilin-type N-terminal cleavage/methylation domain-containing protein